MLKILLEHNIHINAREERQPANNNSGIQHSHWPRFFYKEYLKDFKLKDYVAVA